MHEFKLQQQQEFELAEQAVTSDQIEVSEPLLHEMMQEYSNELRNQELAEQQVDVTSQVEEEAADMADISQWGDMMDEINNEID